MAENNIKLNFSKFSGNYEIAHNGFSWISDGRKPYITIRKKVGDKYIAISRPFWSALEKKTNFSESRIVTRYSDFIAFGKKLPFTIVCTAEITGEDTVVHYSQMLPRFCGTQSLLCYTFIFAFYALQKRCFET